MVNPILLYGCELWGLSNCDIIERVHLKYCKLLLNLKSSTPNSMIYGKLGRYPLYIDIKQRMVSYWIKLITGKQSCNLIFILDFNQTSLMKICVSQIYEKPHSSKIVFTLFNQDEKDFLTLCKFRTTNHKLPIEHGRWNNIPRENRKCNYVI
jgi:hypothetical protein